MRDAMAASNRVGFVRVCRSRPFGKAVEPSRNMAVGISLPLKQARTSSSSTASGFFSSSNSIDRVGMDKEVDVLERGLCGGRRKFAVV